MPVEDFLQKRQADIQTMFLSREMRLAECCPGIQIPVIRKIRLLASGSI